MGPVQNAWGQGLFFTPSSNCDAYFFSVNEHGVSTLFRAAAEMFFQVVATLFLLLPKQVFFKA